MAKSGILGLRNYSNVSTEQTTDYKSKHPLQHDSPRTPPDEIATALAKIPSSQASPSSDLTKKIVGTFNNLELRSTSNALSDDSLESLEDVSRLNTDAHESGYNAGYEPRSGNSAPLIDCKHFLEIQDTKHRYGTYLRPYYDLWMASGSTDPFFIWLDEGGGRNVDASKMLSGRPHCVSRQDLERAVVYYCTANELEQYQVIVRDGKLVWANGNAHCCGTKNSVVDTGSREDRWIFVIDEEGNFFLNKKAKGRFHHSSFVAGRPIRAAGRIVIENGDIVTMCPTSGHYLTPHDLLLRAAEDLFGCSMGDVSALICTSSEMDRS